MTKKKNCKYCGNFSGKKSVCSKCKELTPNINRGASENSAPFNRQIEIDKLNKKGKRKLWKK